MIATDRGRMRAGATVALLTLAMAGFLPVQGQTPAPSKKVAKAVAKLEPTGIPANPTDPIATVNGEAITRQQLADECVARKGAEILETLIARRLIDQAVRGHRLEITEAEVDAEISRIAKGMGIPRLDWLRALDKERGITPEQYARDIIYPTLALRKLTAPRVQVTPDDVKAALEAHYGEKVRCRVIMVDNVGKAKEIWNELRKNPGGFAKIAKDDPRSLDQATKPLGGLMLEPISRHSSPSEISKAVFLQLVDGEPEDKDPAHKPKDGDFTGPIQVPGTTTWVIMKREGLDPAQPHNPNDVQEAKQFRELIYESKVQAEVKKVYAEMIRTAAIDNKLTGQSRLANEEQHPDHRYDGQVKRSMDEQPPQVRKDAATAASKPSGRLNLPTPAGVTPIDTAKEIKGKK